jgi:hypothetical protein
VTLQAGAYQFASLSTSSSFFGGHVNLIFGAGSSVMFNGPLTLNAPGNYTLAPGEYAYGLSITGATINVTLLAGNYTFGTHLTNQQQAISEAGVDDSINGDAGVLLYVSAGSVNFDGFSQYITLAPESSGPYTPVVLWQSASDSDPISIIGAVVGIAAVGGTIYAPTAVLGSTWSGGDSYNIGGLVAAGVTCPLFGNQLTIGG